MDAYSRLRQVDFMAHLHENDLHELAKICETRSFIAGEDIVQQGDLTKRFCIIDEGTIHFRKTDIEGFEHPFGYKGPGEYFGKQMFSAQEPSEFTAEAHGQTTLYIMERARFDELCQAHPEILKHLPDVVAARKSLTHGFTWLSEGEVVALTVSRHVAGLLKSLVLPLLLVLAVVIPRVLLSFFNLPINDILLLLITAGISVVALFMGGLRFMDWRLDMLVITNKRVAQFERQFTATELVNQIPIDKIESISVTKLGLLQTALGVSTIEIQSAGAKDSHIVFDRVANAEFITQTIQKQRGLLRARRMAEDRERFRRRIDNELRHYVLRRPMEEEPEPPKAKPRRSFWPGLRALWHWMFAYEIRDGDTITWRKHWLGLLRHARRELLFGLGLVLVLALYFSLLRAWQLIPEVPFLMAWAVAALVDLAGLAYEWEDWRNDTYMITERAIIDVERKPLGLASSSKEALLINVQDVKSHRPGILHALLNYGSVEVRVGGGGEPLVFREVPDPEDIAAEIFRHLEAFRLKQRERETSLQSRNIVDALVAYHRLLMFERHGDQGEVIEEIKPESPEGPRLSPGDLVATAPALPATAAQGRIPITRPPRDDALAEFPSAADVE